MSRARFEDAVAQFEGDSRVSLGSGFGSSPARRVDGRIFAMFADGALVVKLPSQRVDELVADGNAVPFDAGKGRPMREWARITASASIDWAALVGEAYAFVGSIGNAPRPRSP